MPIERYGVLRGKAIAAKREDGQSTPHYQVQVRANNTDYRLAINVKSQGKPSDLLFLVNEDFHHLITAALSGLAAGFTALPSKPGGAALDYIRGNLFNRLEMHPLPPSTPGPDNDLSDWVEHYVARAIADPQAELYAFGQRWGPEQNVPDKIFHFSPGNGVHDIHMNQGNDPKFKQDDGVWQDGGLLIHFPANDQWVALFLAFQSQAWHTDDKTGHASADVPHPGPGPQPSPGEPDQQVRIVGALANPSGGEPELETVTLLNASPDAIDLGGWQIADKLKNKHTLSGTIGAGTTLVVNLPQTVKLGNSGGLVTLLNPQGLKVDGVSYTKEQAQRQGWTIVF